MDEVMFFGHGVGSETPPTVDRDIQRAMARDGVLDEIIADGCSTLLVFTRTQDVEADVLSEALIWRRCRVVRLNADEPISVPVDLEVTGGKTSLLVDGHRIDAVYLRYFDADVLYGAGDVGRVFAGRQWVDLPRSIAAAAPEMAVNRCLASDGLTVPGQQLIAQACGFLLPRTVITNRPGDVDIEDLLAKAMTPRIVEMSGTRFSFFPRRVDRERDRGTPAPLAFQELVSSRRELRVYAVGDGTISFAVSKEDAADIWNAPTAMQAAVIETPPVLDAKIRAFALEARLDIAAIDVLETSDGWVFLEVNPVCDWVWYEALADTTAVRDRVSSYLCDRIRQRLQRTTGDRDVN